MVEFSRIYPNMLAPSGANLRATWLAPSIYLHYSRAPVSLWKKLATFFGLIWFDLV